MNKDKSTEENLRNEGIGLALGLAIDARYNEAKEVITQILEIYPQDVEMMTFLAEIFIAENKLQEAKIWLDKVFSLDKNYPRALYDLAGLWAKKGRWSTAIKTYEKAIRYYPRDSTIEIAAVYQDLGCALWEAGNRDDALESWKTCLKYDPKNIHAKHNLRDFTNEYGLPASPVGKAMDDANEFLRFKIGEYLSSKRKDGFENMEEANKIIDKITDVWNKKIVSKYGREIDDMNTKEKKKLFKETMVFFDDN